MNNDKDLFRQALQRQNERVARMKMPDDMEQRVMERIRSKKATRRWLYPATASIAAGILLLLVFRFSQEPVEEQPVVAETVEQSISQPATPIIKEKEEEVMAEVQPTPQPARKQRKAVGKQSISVDPMLAEAEPIQEEAEVETEQEYRPTDSDPMLLAAAFEQDVRARGERLHQEVAQSIKNP